MSYCYRNQFLGNGSASQSPCTKDTLQESLCYCVGKVCVCEFQLQDRLETKTGVLEKVADDYFILRSQNHNKMMLCQTCLLRFITVTY